MASGIRPIGKPNYLGITSMRGADLVEAREYYLTVLVTASRKKDSDTLKAAVDWIVALTSEMRLRGASKKSFLAIG